MRLKTAKTLVYSQADGMLLACNYLTSSAFQCSQDLMVLLGQLENWCDLSEIAALLPEYEMDELQEAIDHLISVSALVQEGSQNALQEKELESTWKWGIPAAMLHYSLQDREFMPMETAEAAQREKAETEGKIELHLSNAQFEQRIVLPDALSNQALLQTMAKRRTIRAALPEPVTLKQVSDCLFAGLGITGETENITGKLPLGMTPSGGARNPYEAYLFARNVEGLVPGIYHYSALEHTLGRMGDLGDVSFSHLVGGQDWGDDKPCMIVLCAQLERTMWKYADANAYRVVLIEAGHIGQNIMLAATEHGLTAIPTGALNQTEIKSRLGLTKITHSPIYCLALAVPDRTAPLTKYLQG